MRLKQFDMEALKTTRKTVFKRYKESGCYCGTYSFWRELEQIIRSKSESYEWIKKPKDMIVLGDVWEYQIGTFNYKHRLHRFAYLYAEYDENQEMVIADHGHKELCNKGTQIKKVKEWYIFPDGRVEYCRKDAMHHLVNNYHEPIYVLSIKSMSNAL